MPLLAVEADDDVVELGVDVASLCTFAVGEGVSVPLVEWTDSDGEIARRLIPQPVTSRFRRKDIIEDFRLPEYFEATFGEFLRMKKCHRAWFSAGQPLRVA